MKSVLYVLVGVILILVSLLMTFPPIDGIIAFGGGFLIGYNMFNAFKELREKFKK